MSRTSFKIQIKSAAHRGVQQVLTKDFIFIASILVFTGYYIAVFVNLSIRGLSATC